MTPLSRGPGASKQLPAWNCFDNSLAGYGEGVLLTSELLKPLAAAT